jgi:hypothetical protein
LTPPHVPACAEDARKPACGCIALAFARARRARTVDRCSRGARLLRAAAASVCP